MSKESQEAISLQALQQAAAEQVESKLCGCVSSLLRAADASGIELTQTAATNIIRGIAARWGHSDQQDVPAAQPHSGASIPMLALGQLLGRRQVRAHSPDDHHDSSRASSVEPGRRSQLRHTAPDRPSAGQSDTPTTRTPRDKASIPAHGRDDGCRGGEEKEVGRGSEGRRLTWLVDALSSKKKPTHGHSASYCEADARGTGAAPVGGSPRSGMEILSMHAARGRPQSARQRPPKTPRPDDVALALHKHQATRLSGEGAARLCSASPSSGAVTPPHDGAGSLRALQDAPDGPQSALYGSVLEPAIKSVLDEVSEYEGRQLLSGIDEFEKALSAADQHSGGAFAQQLVFAVIDQLRQSQHVPIRGLCYQTEQAGASYQPARQDGSLSVHKLRRYLQSSFSKRCAALLRDCE